MRRGESSRLLIAATILFPDLTPGNPRAGPGIGSIVIGFAFKDIFENFIAGMRRGAKSRSRRLLREPERPRGVVVPDAGRFGRAQNAGFPAR